MIINIRGTSGAGKSYLVRRLMEKCGERVELKRARPDNGVETVMGCEFERVRLFVLGRYNVNSGGCDALKWVGNTESYIELIKEHSGLGLNVIFEGLIAGKWATPRYQALNRVAPLHVILLTTPLEDCYAAVRERRAARGVDPAFDTKKTEQSYKEALRKLTRDREVGLDVRKLGREDAFLYCCELLGLGGSRENN